MIVTEQQVTYLIDLAVKYCAAKGLDANEYVESMLEIKTENELTTDVHQLVATLTKYHKEWLQKTMG